MTHPWIRRSTLLILHGFLLAPEEPWKCAREKKLSSNHMKEESHEYSNATQDTLQVSWHMTLWGMICLTAPVISSEEPVGTFDKLHVQSGTRQLRHAELMEQAQCWARGQSHNRCPWPALPESPAVEAATVMWCVKCCQVLGNTKGTVNTQAGNTNYHLGLGTSGGNPCLTWVLEGDRAETHPSLQVQELRKAISSRWPCREASGWERARCAWEITNSALTG